MHESSSKGVCYFKSGAVNYQAMHQSRSRMASTLHLTYICSKACSWRDVNFERRGSYPDNSTVKSEGNASKAGRVTDALVQGPKLTLASDNTKIDTNRGKAAFRDTDGQLYEVSRAGYSLTFRIYCRKTTLLLAGIMTS